MVVNNSSDSQQQEIKSFRGEKAKEREMPSGEMGLSWGVWGGQRGGSRGCQGGPWEDSPQACAQEEGGCGGWILQK